MTYYKSLSADGCSCNGGTSKWSLPKLQKDGTYKPGRWMPRIENIVPCERGYHVFQRKDIFLWVNATLYEDEVRGETIDHEDKTVAQSARLIRPIPGCNERALRLHACRVAEDVLPIFEQAYPDDDRPRKAIETARRHADGKATPEELAAARDAARAATWDAAAARAAAGAAARAAADAAAADAARAAADAARAAAAAAWAAAWAAARAAADAAWAAADAAWAVRDAARAAAWDAAWDAAGAKYTDWLWEMLEGER